jgi:phosphoribosylamine--glycine ligase
MLTKDGPKVLEFNCRFGDPETQVILPRLESDFVEIALKTAQGRLDELGGLAFKEDAALVVVLASGGYPGPFEKGRRIGGLEEAAAVEGVSLYHAGTRRELGHWLTAGGRVLGVTGIGRTMEEARQRAYLAADRITFEGIHFRRDIGVAREARGW